ncbi:SDR family oxidoreductase [Devosia ginsengisoli]|uniref:SDR family oxidoreductase n=1 Tax=Devosia ginsengisoli TaxID=400770 RepID=A0A5B8LUA6_9HYPH|nr:SDR family oxidoreductase [Devosia ginsengisoli]QDZ11897.1 SDR family oxidoreductase [Devosia ginsengisoli]
MQRLVGKIAIVTGAGQGIGEAIARRFAAEGARVVIAERERERGEAVAGQLRDSGAEALCIRTDVSDTKSIEAMVAETVSAFGSPDILVNNAGIAVFGDPLQITDADWQRCMSVDLDGAWYCCRAVLPHMLARGSGAIVNIASNHSFQVIRNTFPYPVAKHGLLGLTRSLALEYAERGVIVNAISPGYIDTPLNRKMFADDPDPDARAKVEARQPLKRLGRPEEIAAVAAMLASDEARFIVGANIVVDGGVTIRMYE